MGVLFLTACGDEEQDEAANGQEDTEQQEESVEEVNEDNAADENKEPTAEEVLEGAVAFYEDLDGLYFVVESEMDMETDGEEDMPEGEATTTTREVQWQFMTDEEYYNRLEVEMTTEGEEEGEEFSEEQPTTYQFTDIEDSSYTISYDEGDTEAIRYESGTDGGEMDDLSSGAYQYEQLLEDAELTYVDEEEVNGYETYHIEAEQDGEVTEYWFDQETYYEIRQETSQSGGDESLAGSADNEIEVVEYEANPEFDESLFEAPDEIEVVDGELEDTLDY